MKAAGLGAAEAASGASSKLEKLCKKEHFNSRFDNNIENAKKCAAYKTRKSKTGDVYIGVYTGKEQWFYDPAKLVKTGPVGRMYRLLHDLHKMQAPHLSDTAQTFKAGIKVFHSKSGPFFSIPLPMTLHASGNNYQVDGRVQFQRYPNKTGHDQLLAVVYDNKGYPIAEFPSWQKCGQLKHFSNTYGQACADTSAPQCMGTTVTQRAWHALMDTFQTLGVCAAESNEG